MGDPAGIGPEITMRAWLARKANALAPFVAYADPADMIRRASLLGIGIETEIVTSPAAALAVFDTRLPIIAVPLSAPSQAGQPSQANASAVIASIERAVEAVAADEASAVVTCPIAKSVLYGAGFEFPGHTEYLAHLAGKLCSGNEPKPVMMLAGGGLRVVPLTIHVPLADVPHLVTTDLIVWTCEIVAAALRDDFGIPAPRIAVAGLNPHAGEDGTIGKEDAAVIAPAVARLKALGLDVSGPHPADTMFHAAARARYDAAVAMYHDQALIPIKTLAFDTGVNVTLGLPFVRTSPDHGTAFDIAAKGVASAASLIAALQMADAMGRQRTAHMAPIQTLPQRQQS